MVLDLVRPADRLRDPSDNSGAYTVPTTRLSMNVVRFSFINSSMGIWIQIVRFAAFGRKAIKVLGFPIKQI
jgi:hypothetical protein